MEEEDGSMTEETYTAAVFLTDQEEICSNLEKPSGRTLDYGERPTPEDLHHVAVYGRVGPGSSEVGEAMEMGDSGLFAEATKYIGYPICVGALPATSFDCSGYIC